MNTQAGIKTEYERVSVACLASGWICPRCKSSNSPMVKSCDCYQPHASRGEVLPKDFHEACDVFGASTMDVKGRSRRSRIVDKRKRIAALLSDRGYSPTSIGRAMNRNHTTILYYLGKEEKT